MFAKFLTLVLDLFAGYLEMTRFLVARAGKCGMDSKNISSLRPTDGS